MIYVDKWDLYLLYEVKKKRIRTEHAQQRNAPFDDNMYTTMKVCVLERIKDV